MIYFAMFIRAPGWPQASWIRRHFGKYRPESGAISWGRWYSRAMAARTLGSTRRK